MENLEIDKTYIFDTEPRFGSKPFKGRVKEITETTYIIKNLDKIETVRYNKNQFKETWRILETL